MTGFVIRAGMAAFAAAILMIGGGALAVRRSRAVLPGRCAALGALAGGLAGTVVFCLWGAAAAGPAGWVPLFDAANRTVCQQGAVGAVGGMINHTMEVFLVFFWGGGGLGAAGGWLARPRRCSQMEIFDGVAPKMALNASITAVPASIVASSLAAAVFSRLADSIGRQTGQTGCTGGIANMPLMVSLSLVLASHFALTLVIPHEARLVDHRCGMDEVKMAAYVGIGASPVLILLLWLANPAALSSPLVIMILLVITGMSLKSLHTLLTLILPRRATFSAPKESWQKTEANLFGTIADSHGPRLAVLCAGCGLVMVLPLYVSVLSILINLANVKTGPALASDSGPAWSLFGIQAAASLGISAASIAVLTIIYLFYLNLGRWFNKRNTSRFG